MRGDVSWDLGCCTCGRTEREIGGNNCLHVCCLGLVAFLCCGCVGSLVGGRLRWWVLRLWCSGSHLRMWFFTHIVTVLGMQVVVY